MNRNDAERPDPDRLLARLARDEQQSRRGRLKIWLGAAPGVGKTFAMLSTAGRQRAQGTDVIIGLVETHGRAETRLLTQDLETLPRRTVEYRGTALTELDLDAALARRPALLLVDELAHTNAPGSRHPKRWQDVQELLEAGIGVYTTLNIQHIESLNDVVLQITGVQVRETVPDAVFDGADEVELVDLPPDVLLERLRRGLVYLPDAAQAASQSFFRKGNLTALRELALRKTAQWVDAQLQRYKQEHGVRRIWPTGDRALVCIGPSPLSARLVRAAHRAAAATRAELFAVFVETPYTAQKLSRADRDSVSQNLRLAESLGARTVTLESRDAARAIIAFARDHNIGRIVLGKSGQPRWKEALFGSFTTDVIRASGDIDVHVIRADDEDAAPTARAGEAPAALPPRRRRPASYLGALAIVAAAIGLAYATFEPPELTAEAMLIVLGIVIASLRCGVGPAIVASLVSVLAFNYLFTEPRFSFAVDQPSYFVAFGVMLLVGVAISTLVDQVRDRAEAAQERKREVAALYSLTRELADAWSDEDVARVTVAHLRDAVAGDIALLVSTGAEGITAASVLASFGVPDWLGPNELGVARWCWLHGKPAGEGTPNLPGSSGLFLPLATREGRSGVLALRRAGHMLAISSRQRLLIETFAEQAALALERLRMAGERQRARQEAETERLRSTLLSSVSHDLRTPLATITGSASSLLDEQQLDPKVRSELLHGIATEARRLNELIANLVFATQLEDRRMRLRRQWTSVEEIVGAALQRAHDVLQAHPVAVDVAADLPLIQADPVLLEQAVFLLLDNAARHTPPGTPVRATASLLGNEIAIEVADEGPGIAAQLRPRIFQRFERGERSTGMGLGLPICRAILQAHGGSAALLPAAGRGAAFQLRLPVPSEQPQVAATDDAGAEAVDG